MPKKYRNHFKSDLGSWGLVFPTAWDPIMDTHITQLQLHPFLSHFEDLAAHDFQSPFRRCVRLVRSPQTSKAPGRTHPTFLSLHRTC